MPAFLVAPGICVENALSVWPPAYPAAFCAATAAAAGAGAVQWQSEPRLAAAQRHGPDRIVATAPAAGAAGLSGGSPAGLGRRADSGHGAQSAGRPRVNRCL